MHNTNNNRFRHHTHRQQKHTRMSSVLRSPYNARYRLVFITIYYTEYVYIACCLRANMRSILHSYFGTTYLAHTVFVHFWLLLRLWHRARLGVGENDDLLSKNYKFLRMGIQVTYSTGATFE